MIRSRRTRSRLARLVAGAFLVMAVGGCAGSPSVTSGSPDASSSPPLPTGSTQKSSPTASPAESPDSPRTFSLLPAKQPADFVSQITCTGSIGASDPVALVQLHAAVQGTGAIVLRDYADPASPRTACTFGGGYGLVAQLVDARHVVIRGTGGAYAVVDLPEVRYHWFHLPSLPELSWATFVAVSPELTEIAWLSSNADGTAREVHLTTASGDKAVATLRPVGGRCGTPDDSNQGAYTNSGSRLYILDQPQPTDNILLVLRGERQELSLMPPDGGWQSGAPAMALWSPVSEALFYRRGSDVWKWTATGGTQPFLPGVSWSYPAITPDGRHLAYAVRRTDGTHNVYIVDLARDGGPNPQLVGKGARNLPVFLNNNQLWYMTETGGGCTGDGTRPKPMIYNLTDSSEAASVIDQVLYVWPSTSSNH